MYRLVIINNDIETIVHEPGANTDLPHITQGELQEKLSQCDTLDFSIPYFNPGYNNIHNLTTLVKVYKVADDSLIFTGRSLNVIPSMDNNGVFTQDVKCESALGFLNDETARRWNLANQTPEQIISYLLNFYNYKGTGTLQTDKVFHVGTIEFDLPITMDYNYETILNAIIKLRNIVGGDIVVREVNEEYYLDLLQQQGANNGVKIELGRNERSISVEYDPTNVITRLIPLGYGQGVNQLDITSQNGGLDYIEDAIAKAKYGIITAQQTNADIQNALTLKTWGQTLLSDNTQPATRIQCDMLDLSTLGLDQPLNLGDTVEISNSVMNFDVSARVVEKDTDLLAPYNPKLAIDTQPIRLSDDIINLKQRSLSLENAPQGNTCLIALTKAENADATHPITFDLDIPDEAININRVYINLHGRKYRAYEKGATAQQVVSTSGPSSKSTSDSGGSSTQTSSSGGGSTQTSNAAGQSTQTSSSGGGATVTSSGGGGHTHLIGINTGGDTKPSTYRDFLCSASQGQDTTWFKFAVNNDYLGANLYTYSTTDHTHSVSVPDHTHSVNTPAHTHDVNIPNHTHDVNIPSHSHGMDHTHQITIPGQEINIEYGIYEGTYPKNVKISVNGQDVGVDYGGDSEIDEYNIDITAHVNKGNNKIEITTAQNGRVEATIYAQIFIQSK